MTAENSGDSLQNHLHPLHPLSIHHPVTNIFSKNFKYANRLEGSFKLYIAKKLSQIAAFCQFHCLPHAMRMRVGWKLLGCYVLIIQSFSHFNVHCVH